MSTEPRTATVTVFVHKSLEIDEPDWCTGHPADALAQYKVDITHSGHEHVIASNGREMFRALIAQAPFASVDRSIGLYVEPTIEPQTCTPDDVEQLAADLEAAATELRAFGRELALILDGGER